MCCRLQTGLLNTAPLQMEQNRKLGDSIYYELNNNNRQLLKRFSLISTFQLGFNFTSKNNSCFNIHFIFQRGLYKVLTGAETYFAQVNYPVRFEAFLNSNPMPDETYYIFTRDSNIGLEISYLINRKELKKNKSLEKEYENRK